MVQFLDEITEAQRGEVDCPRSHNKEMAKAGLELWVWLTLEPMLLVSFPTATLTTISAKIIEWVLCVMDYGKCFIWAVSFNLYNNPMNPPHFTKEKNNWGFKKLKILPKTKNLVSGSARLIWSQGDLIILQEILFTYK